MVSFRQIASDSAAASPREAEVPLESDVIWRERRRRERFQVGRRYPPAVAVRAILGAHPKELHRGDQHSRPADVRDAVRA